MHPHPNCHRDGKENNQPFQSLENKIHMIGNTQMLRRDSKCWWVQNTLIKTHQCHAVITPFGNSFSTCILTVDLHLWLLPACNMFLHAFDNGSTAEDSLPTPSLWPDSEASPSFFLPPGPFWECPLLSLYLERAKYILINPPCVCSSHPSSQGQFDLHRPISSPSADSLLWLKR